MIREWIIRIGLLSAIGAIGYYVNDYSTRAGVESMYDYFMEHPLNEFEGLEQTNTPPR